MEKESAIFDWGESIEELNEKMIKGLASKPIGRPEKCMICEMDRSHVSHWTDADWQGYLADWLWTGQGWACRECSGEYIDMLDLSAC